MRKQLGEAHYFENLRYQVSTSEDLESVVALLVSGKHYQVWTEGQELLQIQKKVEV